jgi:hypothetical protein
MLVRDYRQESGQRHTASLDRKGLFDADRFGERLSKLRIARLKQAAGN